NSPPRLIFAHLFSFVFIATPPTEIYPLSLHDALPISFEENSSAALPEIRAAHRPELVPSFVDSLRANDATFDVDERGHQLGPVRSEEHTSELQSLAYLVCRLLLEKKKKKRK